MDPRLPKFWITFAFLFLVIEGPCALKAEEAVWTPQDSKSESQGDTLYEKGNFDGAEVLYRQVLDRHPDSVPALLFHAKALNALLRLPEALTEERKAVGLEPFDSVALEWLGITLVLSHLYPEAITTLEKSRALQPDDETVAIWLAAACLMDGNKERAETIFEDRLHGRSRDQQSLTADRIANMFYQMGNGPFAVDWWKRSAAWGNQDAARWLSWAYAEGYGVPQDNGASAYWSRRTAAPPFAWFSRLSFADKVIAWAHGWGLVLIVLLAPVLLPISTIAAVGLCLGRGLTRNPAIHWTERARRSYPFRIYFGFCLLLLPLIYAVDAIYYPDFVLPAPKWILVGTALAVGLVICNALAVRWAGFYHDNPGTAFQNLKDIAVRIFIYLPTIGIFMTMAFNLPGQWNVQAGLIIAAGVLAYLWLQYGGWIRMGRMLRLILPADKDLVEDAAALAQRWKHPAPSVWIMRWRKANAFAFPFSNAIVLTTKLRTILNRDETNAVMAHELAHLCEDKLTRFMRLWMPLILLLPLFTLNLWLPYGNWTGILACYVLVIVGFLILRKQSRRMEERADTFGKEAETEAGIYPLALAKLYESNLVPAVMPGKRKVHPHLYDRLLAAGITPNFPRPRPPGRWGLLAALFTIGLNLGCLTAIWLLLF